MRDHHLDVFISSTSLDLPEYRTAVRDVILSLGLFPSGMENWPVNGKDAVSLCYEMLQDAELFIGIYAHRYGWQPEGENGKSITEMEYDWAGDRGLTRLCFVMDDDYPWVDDVPETEEKRAKLESFKARVRGNLAVGFFTSVDDLKAQVTTALVPHKRRDPITELLPYLRWLHNTARQSGLLRVLEPRQNDPSAGHEVVTVDRVYTPMDTRNLAQRDENGRPLPFLSGDSEQQGMLDIDGELSPLTLMEAANLHPRLLILGDPGSGKSTFANFLALCLSGFNMDPDAGWLERLQDQGWEHGAYVPLLVTLRDFAQSVPRDVKEGNAGLIWAHLKQEMEKRKFSGADEVVRRSLLSGHALILFDGLDEVPQEQRDLVRDSVADFMNAWHEKNRYLVTCRVLSYANPAWQIQGMEALTIAPFDEEKIQHFIRAWYDALLALDRNVTAEIAEKRVADLTVGLRHPHLQNIASNPMLLTVMALVHNHSGALPRESARLYEECVKLLMLRWRPHDARALIEELGVREDDLYRLLWGIAFEAHTEQASHEGAADIPEAYVLGIARKRLGDTAKAAAFCDYVEKRAGLLIGRGQDSFGLNVYTFPHRSFQEYLAGCYIASDRFTRRAPEMARSGAWREALLLATGHLVFNNGDIATPLDAVHAMCWERFDPHTEEDWRVVWLAGDMLNLIGVSNVEHDQVGREVLPRVRKHLENLVAGGHLPPVERAAAARALALLEDTRPGVGVRLNARSPATALPEIEWCEVPKGNFLFSDEKREVDLTYPYAVSKYPVTNVQFQAFVDARDGYNRREWWTAAGWSWKGTRVKPDEHPNPLFRLPNHPRILVRWYEVIAFCNWLSAQLQPELWASLQDWRRQYLPAVGGLVRLPTEHEWEKAARGVHGLPYPWGDEFDRKKCNSSVGDTSIGMTSAVGLFPQGESPYHVLDMSGNVWEWCLNEFGNTEACGIDGQRPRALRGGSCINLSAAYLRAAHRIPENPGDAHISVGFRVARTVV